MKFEDYIAITDLKAKYFQYLDAKAWDRMREVFTEDATFEGYAFGTQTGRDAFIATLADFLGDVRSQHMGFMPQFKTVDEHTIRVVWSMHDVLTWEPNSRVYKDIPVEGMHGLRGYGFYEEECTKTGEGWRVSFSRLTRTRIDALTDEFPNLPNYDVVSPDLDWLT